MCDPRKLFEDAQATKSVISFKQLEIYVQEKPTNRAAMRDLGDCYLFRYGCQYDLKKAFDCYEKAAEKGDGIAHGRLGAMYHKGNEIVTKDLRMAAIHYQKAACINYNSSHYLSLKEIVKENPEDGYLFYLLGSCEQFQQSCEKDVASAKRNYETAIRLGERRGYHALGELIQLGIGVKQDLRVAVTYFLAAAKKDLPESIARLESLAAEDRYGYALTALGDYYIFKHNYKKAFECFDKAAKQKHTPAMIKLGRMYQLGQHVKQDISKSHVFYVQAAQAGDAAAVQALEKLQAAFPPSEGIILDIAQCYRQGYGVTINEKSAHEFYEKGLAAGNMLAKLEVALDCYNGIGVAKDIPRAVALMHEIALANNEVSKKAFSYLVAWNDSYRLFFQIGSCYFSGAGVEQNYKTAIAYLKASQDERALSLLGSAYEVGGRGVEKDIKAAVNYYLKSAKINGKTKEGSELAFERLQTLANLRYPEPSVLHALAECYEKGYATAINPKLAAHYYQREMDLLYNNYREGAYQGHEIPNIWLSIKNLTKPLLTNLLKVLKTDEASLPAEENSILIATIQKMLNTSDSIKSFLINVPLRENLCCIQSAESKCLLDLFEKEHELDRYIDTIVDPKLRELKTEIAEPKNPWKSKFLFLWLNRKPDGIDAIDAHLTKLDNYTDEEKLTHYAAIAKLILEKQQDLDKRHDTTKDFYSKHARDLNKEKIVSSTQAMTQVLRKPPIPSAPPLETNKPSVLQPLIDLYQDMTASTIPPTTVKGPDDLVLPPVIEKPVPVALPTRKQVMPLTHIPAATPFFFPPITSTELPEPEKEPQDVLVLRGPIAEFA